MGQFEVQVLPHMSGIMAPAVTSSSPWQGLWGHRDWSLNCTFTTYQLPSKASCPPSLGLDSLPCEMGMVMPHLSTRGSLSRLNKMKQSTWHLGRAQELISYCTGYGGSNSHLGLCCL